jgi:drug/metabolite transporter (DMT)-like permease
MDTSKVRAGRRLAAIFLVALMNIIWGANFPFIKPALESVSPFVFAFFRFLTASLILVPLAGKEALGLFKGKSRGRIVVLGLVGMCLAQITQTLALQLSTASDISIMATTTPLWIAFLAWLWLKENPPLKTLFGLILAMAGILIILWPQGSGIFDLRRIAGDLIYLVTALSWAAYTVLGKKIMQDHPPLPVTTAAVWVGTLAIIPFALYELLAGYHQTITLPVMGGILYSGVLVTALGFPILFWSLKYIDVNKAGILTYLQPIAGVWIAWLLLGENLSAMFFMGGGMVFLAVGITLFNHQGEEMVKISEMDRLEPGGK